MATYNFFDGSIEGQMVPPQMEIGTNQVTVLRNVVDFALQNIDQSAGDLAQVLRIPADTTVLTAGIRVITGEASTTVDIGVTGTNIDQWGDALSGATAGAVLGLLNAPLHFSAADTIDLIPGTAVDWTSLKVEVFAECIKQIDTY